MYMCLNLEIPLWSLRLISWCVRRSVCVCGQAIVAFIWSIYDHTCFCIHNDGYESLGTIFTSPLTRLEIHATARERGRKWEWEKDGMGLRPRGAGVQLPAFMRVYFHVTATLVTSGPSPVPKTSTWIHFVPGRQIKTTYMAMRDKNQYTSDSHSFDLSSSVCSCVHKFHFYNLIKGNVKHKMT